MRPNLFEPRRLRASAQGPSSIEGRLAHQLRVLSVFAPTPRIRGYSALPRRRRYILTAVRVAAVATIVLAVSGVATATAAFVVRRVWPRVAAVDRVRSLPALPVAKHRGRAWEPSEGSRLDSPHRLESPAQPAGVRLRESEVDRKSVV